MKSLISDQVQAYIDRVVDQPTVIQDELNRATLELDEFNMKTPHDQTVFLTMLAQLTRAKRVIEVGVFTGYSTLSLASALPEDGYIVACDTNKEWSEMAKSYWDKAGVSNKIDFRMGYAQDTLQSLIDGGQSGSFDMAYIDADKRNYDFYYEACLNLVRTNGLLCIDNMLWSGRVAEEKPPVNEDQKDKYTQPLRELAFKISNDERVSKSLLPVGDGLFLVRKR